MHSTQLDFKTKFMEKTAVHNLVARISNRQIFMTIATAVKWILLLVGHAVLFCIFNISCPLQWLFLAKRLFSCIGSFRKPRSENHYQCRPGWMWQVGFMATLLARLHLVQAWYICSVRMLTTLLNYCLCELMCLQKQNHRFNANNC